MFDNRSLLPLGLVWAALQLVAQCPLNPAESRLVLKINPAKPAASAYGLTLRFTRSIDRKPAPDAVSVKMHPSGKVLQVDSVNVLPGQPNTLEIKFRSAVLPDPGDTGFNSAISAITFSGNPPEARSDCKLDSDNYFSQGNLKKLLDQQQQKLEDAIAAAKTSEEKNLFVALSGVAASGVAGAAGDAQMNFNYWILPGLYGSLAINKSSLAQADPKQFDFSFTVRRSIPIFLGRGEKTADTAEGRKLINLILDGTSRFEGDATRFAVNNAVFDMPVQFASRTMGFGPLGANGYWRFRIMPAGVESGYNLGSTNPNLQNYRILRLKYGGSLGLLWDPKNVNALPQRVELDVQATDRFLAENESAWDATENLPVAVARGHHPWIEADAKLYLFQSDVARIGFRLSFIRGSLPPVFNETKAFRFGLVFETRDDKTSEGRPLSH